MLGNGRLRPRGTGALLPETSDPSDGGWKSDSVAVRLSSYGLSREVLLSGRDFGGECFLGVSVLARLRSNVASRSWDLRDLSAEEGRSLECRLCELFGRSSLSGVSDAGALAVSVSVIRFVRLAFADLISRGPGISLLESSSSRKGSGVSDSHASIFAPRWPGGGGSFGGSGSRSRSASGSLNIFLDSSSICANIPPFGGFAGPRARLRDNSEKSASLFAQSPSSGGDDSLL